ncbi:hypothetical protein FISHEDRAFT_59782, partial [Fistulina hepatica ATCC 64428]
MNRFYRTRRDAVTADLMLRNLSYVRPMLVKLAKYAYDNNPIINSAYYTQLFVNSRGTTFKDQDFTNLLNKFTNKIFKFQVGIRDWRHISLGFFRHHCKTALTLTAGEQEEDDVEDLLELQSGHSTKMGQRLYAVSFDTIANKPSDEELAAYLDVSTDVQNATGLVPGGVKLPYREARTDRYLALSGAKVFTSRLATASTAPPTPASVPAAIPTNGGKIEQELADIKSLLVNNFKDIMTENTYLQQSIRDLRTDVHSLETKMNERQPITAPPPEDELEYEDDTPPPPPPQSDFPSSPSPSPPPRTHRHSDDDEEQKPPRKRVHVSEPSISTSAVSTSAQPPMIPDTLGKAANVLHVLRTLVKNPQAKWSSKYQCYAVNAVLRNTQDVCVFLPTGAGKSMMVAIPAMLENGITQ